MDSGASAINFPLSLMHLGTNHVHRPQSIKVADNRTCMSYGTMDFGVFKAVLSPLNLLISEPYLCFNFPLSCLREGEGFLLLDRSRFNDLERR